MTSRTLTRTVAILAVSTALWAFGATTASAHSGLESSNPADGSIVTEAPAAITLTFNEPLLDDADSISLNAADGTNITSECGSMYPQTLCAKVREYRADLGIAHDGDADRVILCDEAGQLVDGDDIMAISALQMLAEGRLAKNTLVATVMSNAGLDAAIRAAGGEVIRTAVGDKNVIDCMLTHGYNFGGEQSGHLIFREHSTTGDGLVAALQILSAMRTRGEPLSKLARCWTRYPQLVTNVPVRVKTPFEELEEILDLVKQAEAEVQPKGGRVLLRYSGTEPKARLLIEGPDMDVMERWTLAICGSIRRQVGQAG
jgi:phosphoglucosamine mutase